MAGTGVSGSVSLVSLPIVSLTAMFMKERAYHHFHYRVSFDDSPTRFVISVIRRMMNVLHFSHIFFLDRLLVGAPQAEPFHLGRTGALYKCPLNTYSTDCDLLNVEPSNNTSKNFSCWFWNVNNQDFPLFLVDVDRNDQWLGVTVKSQGEGGKCAYSSWSLRFTNSFFFQATLW